MNDVCLFVVFSLATFAITYLIRYFDGPFDMLVRFRDACGIVRVPVLDTDGCPVDIVEEFPTKLAEFVGCHWCITTWISLVTSITFVMYRDYQLALLVPFWFAFIAVSGLIHDWNMYVRRSTP